jgi:hypothetical protein
MIAEQIIREALDCPEPIEAAKREAIRACTAAESALHRAKWANDTRAIHAAQEGFTAAKHALLAIETGRGA